MKQAKPLLTFFLIFLLAIFFGFSSLSVSEAVAKVYINKSGEIVVEREGLVLGDDDEPGDDKEEKKNDDKDDDDGKDKEKGKEDKNDKDDEKDDEGDKGEEDENKDEDKDDDKDEIEDESKNDHDRDENEQEFEIESKEGKLKIKYKQGDGEEFELEMEEELEIEESEDKDKIKIRARNDDDEYHITRNGISAKTGFPLKIDPKTNELIVVTQAGERVVAVLPDQAIKNILSSNVLDRVNDNVPSGTEVVENLSDNTVTTALKEDVNLVEDEDGNLVYEVEGEKDAKLLGFYDIKIKRKVRVSAETGEFKNIEESFLDKFLSILSIKG